MKHGIAAALTWPMKSISDRESPADSLGRLGLPAVAILNNII